MQKKNATNPSVSFCAMFTERELEVLQEVVTGASNKEIAERMSLSVDTIKYHLKNLMRKTGCHTRTELAVYICRSGVLSSGENAKSL